MAKKHTTTAVTKQTDTTLPVLREALPVDLQSMTDQQIRYAYKYVYTLDAKQALEFAGYNSKWSPTRPMESEKVRECVRFLQKGISQSLPTPTAEQIINRLAKRFMQEGDSAPSDRGLKDLSGELREWMGVNKDKGVKISIVLPDTYKQFGLPVGEEVKLAEEAEIIEETET